MRHAVLPGLACAALLLVSPAAAEATPEQAARVQAAIDGWLAERGPAEKVTGIAAYVSFASVGPGPGPGIEAFAGRTGRGPDDPPVGRDTLFAMGSTSKSFAAAILLKLEAEGLLSIDDTLGKWLPQYPAWSDVSIRRLLDMTSGIPNYTETEAMSRIWVEDPSRNLTAEELIALVYPTGHDDPPATTGYHYSNTNYILAALVAAKAANRPYPQLVEEVILGPQGLHATFYDPGTYPPELVARMAHGYFENPACAELQPDCTQSWNAPLIGRDVRDNSSSWAQAAGGAIATARDVDGWMRAVFGGKVVPPEQQAEWLGLVSTRTGAAITDVSPADPQGFALGLVKGTMAPYGDVWFYQGETLGFRTLYVWFEADDILVTVQTNSQPADDENRLQDAVIAIYDAVKPAP
ncbi:serine hydrolase [Amaricoccus sp.]|uniref:serine hydrolase domain-containing protein n=1 Tax=Amaricoccus sp. TaxID=1872485 RepID=UPI00261FF214|nr:serine hydrolase [Amaricoccus sp.]HRO10145.1 serine hydrolase [Amaricoccus sp.]